MKNKTQIIRNIVFFILLIVITFVIIFDNFDFNKTINILLSTNKLYILIGLFCMFMYFVFEGLNIRNILNCLGNKVRVLQSIKLSMIGFFFSGITPAASGGQPMEIFFMNKEKIPVIHGTIAMLIHLICFQIVTIILGFIGFAMNYDLYGGFVWVFIVGVSLNTLALSVMLIGLLSYSFASKLGKLAIKIMKKLKIKNIESKKEKIEASLIEFKNGSLFIKKHKNIFVKAIIFALLQVVFYHSIPFFVYKSFGLSDYNLIEILFVQAMLFVSVSSIPVPGAVGVSESVFLKVYLTIFGIENLASAMLVNRLSNFYLYILLGLILTLVKVYKLNLNKEGE